jgi:hypothetical protein
MNRLEKPVSYANSLMLQHPRLALSIIVVHAADFQAAAYCMLVVVLGRVAQVVVFIFV